MKVLITGANGFIGKNLLTHIQSKNKFKILTLEKKEKNFIFVKKILDADIIFHLAGENRSKFKNDYVNNNYNLTKKIVKILEDNNKKTKLIFASSTQVAKNNIYGITKKKAEKELIRYKNKNSNILIYRLPNIFGKWSKPYYNSVVATFCYQVANNKKISVFNKKSKITLLYIDDLISQFLKKINKKKEKKTFETLQYTYKIKILDLANKIKSFKKNKIDLIENLDNSLIKKLHSTYISFLPKKNFVYKIKKKVDHRGEFTEIFRNSKFGQFSLFSILPGKIRGNHYHHTKLEKFVVVQGIVRFNFIDLSTNKKFSLIQKNNKKICSTVVQTIPGWAHNIENIGPEIAILVVWCNEIYNPKRSDTFFYNI
jgi:UDP-2-acetamido-2,6-beta-L-arabino-hexul-4-ose reductase